MDQGESPDQWTDARVWDLVRYASDNFGAEIALTLGKQRYTYADLEAEVKAFAHGLWQEGHRPDDRIGVLVGDIPEAIIAILAGMAMGSPVVLLSTRNTPHELEHLLETANVSTVITEKHSAAGDLLERNTRVLSLEPPQESEVSAVASIDRVISIGEDSRTISFASVTRQEPADRQGVKNAMASVDATDTAAILFTSGTTSKPKAVIRTHRNLIPHAVDAAEWYGITRGEGLVNAYPISSAAGVLRALMAISRGATSMLQGSYDVDRTIALLSEGGVGYLSGPDTVFRDLLEHDAITEIDTESLQRVFMSMGGGLDVEFGERVEAVFETPIENAYGLTEANPLVLRTKATHPFEARVRPGGHPGYQTEVRLDGDDSAQGEICIRGISVTPEYENNPEANAAAFDDAGWFYTDDTGFESSFSGKTFTIFAHRADAMFQVGSFNVSPREVEACLLDHPGVSWAGVASVPHGRLGQVPAAAVTAVDATLTAEDLTAFCEARLSSYKVPRTIFLVDESEIPYMEGHHGRKLSRDDLQTLIETKYTEC